MGRQQRQHVCVEHTYPQTHVVVATTSAAHTSAPLYVATATSTTASACRAHTHIQASTCRYCDSDNSQCTSSTHTQANTCRYCGSGRTIHTRTIPYRCSGDDERVPTTRALISTCHCGDNECAAYTHTYNKRASMLPRQRARRAQLHPDHSSDDVRASTSHTRMHVHSYCASNIAKARAAPIRDGGFRQEYGVGITPSPQPRQTSRRLRSARDCRHELLLPLGRACLRGIAVSDPDNA